MPSAVQASAEYLGQVSSCLPPPHWTQKTCFCSVQDITNPLSPSPVRISALTNLDDITKPLFHYTLGIRLPVSPPLPDTFLRCLKYPPPSSLRLLVLFTPHFLFCALSAVTRPTKAPRLISSESSGDISALPLWFYTERGKKTELNASLCSASNPLPTHSPTSVLALADAQECFQEQRHREHSTSSPCVCASRSWIVFNLFYLKDCKKA